MLGTLANYAPPLTTRRVDPAATLTRVAEDVSDAGAPPRRLAPETATPEAIAESAARLAGSRQGERQGRAEAAEAASPRETGRRRRRPAAGAPAAGEAPAGPREAAEKGLGARRSAGARPPASGGAAAASVIAAAFGGGAPAGAEALIPVTPISQAIASVSASGAATRADGAPSAALSPATDPAATAAPPTSVASFMPLGEAEAEALRGDLLYNGLSQEEQVVLEKLVARDRDVRAHEMAHVIAGRPWAGPPVYLYQTGPDGRRYAIGGFVPIDVTPVSGDPQATAEKMRIVSAAALANGEASAADRRVAAIAQAQLQEALAAISGGRAAQAGGEGGDDDANRRIFVRI